MFILNRQQVKFCKVVFSQSGNTEISSAISFNGFLFTKGETFLSSEKTKACKRVQELLEVPQQLVLLLEDTAELALYHLNPQVKLLESQADSDLDNQGDKSASKTPNAEKGLLKQLRLQLNTILK